VILNLRLPSDSGVLGTTIKAPGSTRGNLLIRPKTLEVDLALPSGKIINVFLR
jgi:hypothetical protein